MGSRTKKKDERKRREEVNTIKDTIERLQQLAEISELGEDTPIAFKIEEEKYEMAAFELSYLIPVGKDEYTEEYQWVTNYKLEDAEKTQPVVTIW